MSKVSDLTVAHKLCSLSDSAKSRGIEFDLSFRTLKILLEKETCYYTGVTFQETGELARSIDRKDNDQGYVDHNVVACTVAFNSKKKDLSLEDIDILYNKVNKTINRKK